MSSDDPAPAPGVFSCVVDSHPRYAAEVQRWFAVLTRVAQVSPRDLTVHYIGEPTAALLRLSRYGVRLAEVAPFDTRVPTCNKIAGAVELARRPFGPDDVVVLSDTDVAIARDPRRLPVPRDAMGGRIVDGPNPPVAVLAGVFARAGLELPQVVRTGRQADGLTIDGNFNGGLYLLPGRLVPRLAAAWAAFARGCLISTCSGRTGTSPTRWPCRLPCAARGSPRGRCPASGTTRCTSPSGSTPAPLHPP